MRRYKLTDATSIRITEKQEGMGQIKDSIKEIEALENNVGRYFVDDVYRILKERNYA